VFAESSPVDMMRAGAGHQFTSHVADGDCVLVVFGILVALVGDFNESGDIDVVDKLFGLCAFLCRLVRTNRDDAESHKNDKTFNYVESSTGRRDIAVFSHQSYNSLHFQSTHTQDIERCQ
jgi:hypothetical protein